VTRTPQASSATSGILSSAEIKLLCLINDERAAQNLVDDFTAASDRVTTTAVIATGADATAKLADGGFNAICVDVFHGIGTSAALRLVGEVRRRFPQVPICLLGNKADFMTWPGVPNERRNKFQHYYKIELDAPDEIRRAQVDIVAVLFLADAIKAAGFEHYQTLELPFTAKPATQRFSTRFVALLSAGITAAAALVAPNLIGVETRTCTSLQQAYPDRVLCTGTQAGYYWRVGDRIALFAKEGFTHSATTLRCSSRGVREGLTGEIVRPPNTSFSTEVVVARLDAQLRGTETLPDPDAGVYETRCAKIPWHPGITWYQLR
jgi:hypothetical protein